MKLVHKTLAAVLAVLMLASVMTPVVAATKAVPDCCTAVEVNAEPDCCITDTADVAESCCDELTVTESIRDANDSVSLATGRCSYGCGLFIKNGEIRCATGSCNNPNPNVSCRCTGI